MGSQLDSVLFKFLLQLPHPVALVIRVLFGFPELVADVGPAHVSYCVFSHDPGSQWVPA